MKRREKKFKKHRGNRSHGYGSKKKHRGAGSRGGRGNAGTGKRADTKKPSINPKTYFGRHGFASIYQRKVKVINVGHLNSNYNTYKALEKEGVLDLRALGYSKLLSTGSLAQKFSIKIAEASPKAVEKVEKAGGKVELLKKAEPKKVEPKKEEVKKEDSKKKEVKEPKKEPKQKPVKKSKTE